MIRLLQIDTALKTNKKKSLVTQMSHSINKIINTSVNLNEQQQHKWIKHVINLEWYVSEALHDLVLLLGADHLAEAVYNNLESAVWGKKRQLPLVGVLPNRLFQLLVGGTMPPELEDPIH